MRTRPAIVHALILYSTVCAGVGVHATEALAYQCREPRTFAEEIAQATAIFTGTVMSIEEHTSESGRFVDGQPIHYTVKINVTKSWRGTPEGVATVTMPYLGGGEYSCGIEVKPGQAYLIYAYGQDGLTASISTRGVGPCSRTRLLSQASDDVSLLDRGVPPSSEPK